MNFYSNITVLVPRFLTTAIIIFLAPLVTSIQIPPSVNLDPAAPQLEWAACLMVIFVAWPTAIFARAALLQTLGRLTPDRLLFFNR